MEYYSSAITFYRSAITKKIMTYPYDLDAIYGEGTVDTYVKNGLLEKIDPSPTVIECLKHGTKIVAIQRYREIHGGTLKEVKDTVEKIMDDMGMSRY